MVLIHDSFCWFVSKRGRDVRKMPFNFLKATVVLCLNPEMIPTISGSHLFLLWVRLIEDYFIPVSLVNFFFFFFAFEYLAGYTMPVFIVLNFICLFCDVQSPGTDRPADFLLKSTVLIFKMSVCIYFSKRSIFTMTLASQSFSCPPNPSAHSSSHSLLLQSTRWANPCLETPSHFRSGSSLPLNSGTCLFHKPFLNRSTLLQSL